MKKRKGIKTKDKKKRQTAVPVYYTIRQMMRGEGITREEAMRKTEEIKSNVLYNKDLS